MAKRRKEKYSVELTGLIIFLVSIIGFGEFGVVGSIIKGIFVFLFGYWWFILNLLVLVLSVYMVFKREIPKFLTLKLTALYAIIISLLVVNNLSIMSPSSLNVFELINDYSDSFLNLTSGYELVNINLLGGGFIGTIFYSLFVFLLDIKGTYIILSVISIVSLFILLDISFFDSIVTLKELIVRLISSKKKTKKEKVKKEKIIKTDKKEEEENIEHTTTLEELTERKTSEDYTLPTLALLNSVEENKAGNSKEFIDFNIDALEKVLKDFQIEGKVVETHEGPAVTQFEVEIKAATKLSRITSIHKEIALALSARDVRIQAPIPGKNTVGIEIPNKEVSMVPIKGVLNTIPRKMMNSNILLALGKDLMGRSMFGDLTKMPHLLVAGSTGSGKSVCINSFIASILMFNNPDEVRLILIDPKKVELSNYNGIPHLETEVVTDPKKANLVLKNVVNEMDKRYQIFEDTGSKNLESYNKKYKDRKIPYIVVIIDELADLMLVAQKEVEDSIMRITQMARAAGIHLIAATQRPSTDIITGIVKANIPSRIAFTVASYVDSRTILDQSGAEKLLGKGDMLYLPMGENNATRIQGTFISEDEIERLIEYVKTQESPTYNKEMVDATKAYAESSLVDEDFDDPLYDEVYEFAIDNGKLSASLIQRRFRVGYNRAARILDELEKNGVVGPQQGSKPRDVLIEE